MKNTIHNADYIINVYIFIVINHYVINSVYSHSIVNELGKPTNDEGFRIVLLLDTMKNTLFRICCGAASHCQCHGSLHCSENFVLNPNMDYI